MGKDKDQESAAVARIEGIVADSPFDVATLAGDVRDCMLEIVKHRPKPWSAMSEDDQLDVARAIEYAARDIVTKVAEAVALATNANSPIRAIVEGFGEKQGGGIKASLKIKTIDGDDEDLARAIINLHKSTGKVVMITLASAADYLGERSEFEPTPDQSGLDFEAGSDVIKPEENEDGDDAATG